MPDARGLSPRNLRYIESFYILYRKILQQVVAKLESNNKTVPLEKILKRVFLIPWGHHVTIINSCFNRPEKAWFYIIQSSANNWSRAILKASIDNNLYERSRNAITNFDTTIPEISTYTFYN